jgi:uncharacterized membrane protein
MGKLDTLFEGRRPIAACALMLMLAAPAWAAGRAAGATYQVRGVEPSDTLKLRAGPDPQSNVRATIPPDAHGLLATGRQRLVGTTVWREIQYQKIRGWVNGRYLAVEREPDTASKEPAPAAREVAPAPSPAPAPTAREVAPAPATLRKEPAPPLRQGATATPAGLLEEDLVCVTNEPLWRIEIRKNGRVTCTETCDGPPGLHVTPVRPLEGKPGWIMDVLRPNGDRFLSLAVRRHPCTEDLSDDHYAYDVAVRRPGGKIVKGCCNPLSAENTAASPPAPEAPPRGPQ